MTNEKTRERREADALTSYLRSLKDCPPLTREEETVLARKYRDEGDTQAGHKLVQANLRAVVKIASRYQRSDVGLLELIQEGNLGLLQAVNRFDPERGVRLVTYASWWIRAYVQRYLQGRQHHVLEKLEDLPGHALQEGGKGSRRGRSRQVPVREVSLDRPITEGARSFLGTLIADDSPNQEAQYFDREAQSLRARLIRQGMVELDEQEQQVIQARYLKDRPRTLKEIGEELGLSRQRIHQIELKARKKLGEALSRHASTALA